MTEYTDAVDVEIKLGDKVVLAENRQVPLLVGEVVGFKDGHPSKVMITYVIRGFHMDSIKKRNINPKGLAVVGR